MKHEISFYQNVMKFNKNLLAMISPAYLKWRLQYNILLQSTIYDLVIA